MSPPATHLPRSSHLAHTSRGTLAPRIVRLVMLVPKLFLFLLLWLGAASAAPVPPPAGNVGSGFGGPGTPDRELTPAADAAETPPPPPAPKQPAASSSASAPDSTYSKPAAKNHRSPTRPRPTASARARGLDGELPPAGEQASRARGVCVGGWCTSMHEQPFPFAHERIKPCPARPAANLSRSRQCTHVCLACEGLRLDVSFHACTLVKFSTFCFCSRAGERRAEESSGRGRPAAQDPPLEGAKRSSAAHGRGSRSSMAQLRADHRLCGLVDPEFDLRHGRRWFVSQ